VRQAAAAADKTVAFLDRSAPRQDVFLPNTGAYKKTANGRNRETNLQTHLYFLQAFALGEIASTKDVQLKFTRSPSIGISALNSIIRAKALPKALFTHKDRI